MTFYSAAAVAIYQLEIKSTYATQNVAVLSFLVEADDVPAAEQTAKNQLDEQHPEANSHYVVVQPISDETLDYIASTTEIGQ
jgi:hypothetical protein